MYKRQEKFTLSKGSGNLLRSMKQDLSVDVYVTKGLPKLDAFVRDLRDLLQEYKNAGRGKFNYTLIEARDEDTKKKAKDAGLVEQPFGCLLYTSLRRHRHAARRVRDAAARVR